MVLSMNAVVPSSVTSPGLGPDVADGVSLPFVVVDHVRVVIRDDSQSNVSIVDTMQVIVSPGRKRPRSQVNRIFSGGVGLQYARPPHAGVSECGK